MRSTAKIVSLFSELRADYKLHGSKILNPTFLAICNYRFGHWALSIKFAPIKWMASKFYGLNQFVLLVISGIELNREAIIGCKLHLIHTGNIHVHPDAVIGDRCGIMHDVTIGTNTIPGIKIGYSMQHGAPKIGNDVFIGAGAKVLGNIHIGDNAIIAANSLVTVNVPSGCIAIGVPARVIRREKLEKLQEAS